MQELVTADKANRPQRKSDSSCRCAYTGNHTGCVNNKESDRAACSSIKQSNSFDRQHGLLYIDGRPPLQSEKRLAIHPGHQQEIASTDTPTKRMITQSCSHAVGLSRVTAKDYLAERERILPCLVDLRRQSTARGSWRNWKPPRVRQVNCHFRALKWLSLNWDALYRLLVTKIVEKR